MVATRFIALTFAIASADIRVTTYVYSDSSCTNQLYSQGPNDVGFVTCEAYRNALAATGCENIDGCCEAPGGLFYHRHQCETTAEGTLCAALETSSLTSCRLDGQAIDICLSTDPSVACCSSLLLWDATCEDTSAITPSGILGLLCSYRPSSAGDYYNEQCRAFSPTCSAVEAVVGSLCEDARGCAATNPSSRCCSTLRGLSFVGTDCTVAVDDTCSETAVTYQTLLDRCDATVPVSSVTPSPSPLVSGVRTCLFRWESSGCEGLPINANNPDCSVQYGLHTCQEYALQSTIDYIARPERLGSSCGEEECCRMFNNSYMYSCNEDSGARSSQLSLALLVVLMSTLLAI